MDPSQLIPLAVTLFGACVGSFLNVCIYRIPLQKSVVCPSSSCPKCGHRIRWWENVPVLSWMALRAKCSACGSRIAWRYPAVEALSAIAALALWSKFGLTLDMGFYFIMVCALIVVTFIDLDHQIIPDVITLPGIALGFGSSFFLSTISWNESLLGILAGGGSLYAIALLYYWSSGKEGMGGGDIKLLAMIGAFMGWLAVLSIIFLSALMGSIAGGIMLAAKKHRPDMTIPYGPFLSVAAVVYLFWGRQLLQIYMKLISLG